VMRLMAETMFSAIAYCKRFLQLAHCRCHLTVIGSP
jgi:hypothetical protein